jgi:1,4-dihydroxy-6-naphthoate synthase
MPAHELSGLRVAIPGQYTTAAMLLRLYATELANTVVMPFHLIMEAVARGEVDAGVIIHEGRFTYSSHGLHLIQDLGVWWEEETGHPIPLGGIVARRSLGTSVLRQVEECVRASLRAAFAAPMVSRTFVEKHAQELDESVVAAHINLYVNHFSEDLGPSGQAAVMEFLRRGHVAGLFAAPPDSGVFLPPGL